MSSSRASLFLVAAAGLALTATSFAAKSTSDILPAEKRRAVVELAARLAKPSSPAPLPAELPQPFSPPGFERPDKSDGPAGNIGPAPAESSKPSTDRDTLEVIAAKIRPSGTFILSGEPLLIFGKQRLHVGDQLTVTYEGADYRLELTAITQSTFTLRLNRDEITRPIKPGKTP